MINVSGSLGFGVAVDLHGNVAFYGVAGGGAQAGAEVDAGASVQLSNAPTVDQLSNVFVNQSAHGGSGFGGSTDFFEGSGGIVGGGVTFGAAAGGSATIGATDTVICSSSARGCHN